MIDYRDDRLVEAAAPLLGDFDEGVRCAAADLMIAQEDDSAVPHLSKALFNPEEDSGRLKIKVSQVFQQRRWTIPEDFTKYADRLPSRFTIQDSRVVALKESK